MLCMPCECKCTLGSANKIDLKYKRLAGPLYNFLLESAAQNRVRVILKSTLTKHSNRTNAFAEITKTTYSFIFEFEDYNLALSLIQDVFIF